ncbi:MAG: polysaccharide deacetylase family protein [Wenzhouxiangellaceae bacterium]|nr:polysaccharide deacetylase family protein [Wenzhouxiangellaceae bacterium]
MKILRSLLPALALLASAACADRDDDTAIDADPDPHGVAFLYHHVSAETPPSTSVTPETFASHLEWLADHDYRVWELQRLLRAVLDGAEPVPERVVAITFDDAWVSVFEKAAPLLEERNWPYTIFVNSDAVDEGLEPAMSWDQLRALAERGAAIENHGASHAYLARRPADVDEQAWHERIRADVERGHERLAEEIGVAPSLFAYPYGEADETVAAIVGEHYAFALEQRSGAIGPGSDPLRLPRYPMATAFASLDRLATAASSLPMAVRSVELRPRNRPAGASPESLRLEFSGEVPAGLACFTAGGRSLDVAVQGKAAVVDADGVGRPGRNKINCTAPAGEGRYRWFSWQWLQPRPDGSWPAG